MFLVCFLFIFCIPDIHAADFNVNSTSDVADSNPGDGICDTGAGECTLRAAVMEAEALAGADNIAIPSGTYVLTNGQLVISTGDLAITGADAETTIIDGNGNMRIFYSFPGVDGQINVSISNMTIKNGAGPYQGGGICTQSDLFLSNVIVENCSVSNYGGGVYVEYLNSDASVTIQNSIIRNNSATGSCGSGGGIYSQDPNVNVTVTDSTVSGNTANGYYLCTYSGGGGIYNSAGSVFNLINSTVSGNSAPGAGGDGGGIYNYNGGIMNIHSSTVSGNSASDAAGGVANLYGNATITIDNSTISGNISGGAGSGMLNTGMASGTILNSTVANNSGEGVNNFWGTISARNSLFANNPSGNCFSVTSMGYNLSSDYASFLQPGDMNNTNPLIGPLSNNGGPTETHALLDGSPAIDAGDPANCPAADQRGEPRPEDGNGDSNSVCDIGSYEYTLTIYDLDNSGEVDISDIMSVAARWNTFSGDPDYDPSRDLDGDGKIDIVDIMKVAAQWGWTT